MARDGPRALGSKPLPEVSMYMYSNVMKCYVVSERTKIALHCFTLLFAVGSDISILSVPMAVAISPFINSLNPFQPMMSDDVSDKDKPQHQELRPLLF